MNTYDVLDPEDAKERTKQGPKRSVVVEAPEQVVAVPAEWGKAAFCSENLGLASQSRHLCVVTCGKLEGNSVPELPGVTTALR